MDMELYQILLKHADGFSGHEILRRMADAGDGRITFCGVSLDIVDPSEARDADLDEDEDVDEDVGPGRKLRVTCAFVAGGVFLKVKSDYEVKDGESVGDTVARIFGGK